MNYLIVGDSWGCGEWDKDCNFNPHRGLEQFLLDDGHSVVNLSSQGISNHDIYQRAYQYFQRHQPHDIDTILVFQTEYNRDYKHSLGWEETLGAQDWNSVVQPEDMAMRWISRFYQNLSQLSQSTGCAVKIIGGHSDTLWFDNIEEHYPGCKIICQSMTNLILTGQQCIDQPVLSFYERKTEDLVRKIKDTLNSTDKVERLLTLIDQGYQREMLLRQNPQYFYPDGIHPNRQGIRILYDFLKREQHL